MRGIARFFGRLMTRAFALTIAGLAFVCRWLLAFAALIIRISWRVVLGCAVLSGLCATICILLLGHLPTSQFWQGMIVMLILLGSLTMARAPRIRA